MKPGKVFNIQPQKSPRKEGFKVYGSKEWS